MDLWDTVGVSPRVGLLAALAGLAAAFLLAGGVLFRRSRADRRSGLRLNDR